jgi:DNA repair exonuclease SbcCD ATPase subunit
MLTSEKDKTSRLDSQHAELVKKLSELRSIVSGDSSVEAALKLRDLEKTRDDLFTKKKDLVNQISTVENEKTKQEAKLNKFKKVSEAFSIDDLRKKAQRQKDLVLKIESANREIQQHVKSLTRLKDDVSILDTVPCGDNYPTCPFIKKAFDSKSKVGHEQKEIDEQKMLIKSMQDEVNELEAQQFADKVKKYELMQSEAQTIQIDVSKLIAKSEHASALLNDVSDRLSKVEIEVERIGTVVNNSSNLCGVYDSIKETEEQIEKVRKEQLTNAKNVGSYEASIETLSAEKVTLERDLADLEIFELFNVSMSKKGLPSRLISKLLPLVNAEIKNILLGVCNFTVELEVDEESNSLEVYINYGDKRRIIELGSGMEKMISAIATRVALINMSSLPKSNIFIIDEGFGALDDSNIEACSRLLKSLKKYFNQILIISHVDAIKDAVDNFIEINWIDGGASVRYS